MIQFEEVDRKAEELFGSEEEKEKEQEKSKYDDVEVELNFPTRPELELPTYERVEYNPKTDEEIENSATEQLADYKSSALQSYDIEYENTKEEKEREKSIKEEESKQNEQKVNSDYDSKKKKIDYDLIKRGMVDSSSNQLLKEENENNRRDALIELSNKYSKAIEKIDNEIKKAESKKEQAIAEFNISYALKYTNLVSKLKNERDEAERKAIEYNNKIEKQEFSDKVTKEKTEEQLYSQMLDQYEQERKMEDKEKEEIKSTADYKIYSIFRTQLSSMSKQQAYNAIRNNPIYARNLSAKYYLQLIDEFGR